MTTHITKKDEDELLSYIRRNQGANADRIAKAGLDPRLILTTEVGWLMCFGRFEGNDLEFDFFQLSFLLNKDDRRSILKARQVGFSFEIACESLARCHIKDKHTSVCVSYNLDDAKEKITKAKEIHDDLPLEFQKKIVTDSKTEVSFLSNGSNKRYSRIVSYPSKAPRGKTGDIYLDELAHCQNDRAIYAGATALIARSGGQLTIGSTPLGQRGIFYEIHSGQEEDYKGFWRQNVPWWLCNSFCRDIPGAVKHAPSLPTAMRVATFGTKAIMEQFDSLPLEDFQQEFELTFQDERVSFFPYELITPCMKKDKHEIPIFDNVELLAHRAQHMGQLCLGFDVGRTNHPSELYVFEEHKGKFIERYNEQFKNVPFPEQRERLKKIGRLLCPFMKIFRIDSTGLGMNLAEDLERDEEFGHLVESVTFTMKKKSELANNLKILFQERNIELARDRMTRVQIHSIKQKISASGNTIFDADKAVKGHHADKLWAIAMAVYRKKQVQYETPEVGVRVIGEKKSGDNQPEPRTTGSLPNPFDIPEEVPQHGPENSAIIIVSIEDLERRAQALRTAEEVWADTGDQEKAQELRAQRKRIQTEIMRLRVAS